MQNLVRENAYFQQELKIATIDPSRIITECHATDSYQNVLFSLLRFRAHASVYPKRVTVVTHAFKRDRFMDCHFPAIGLLPRLRAEMHRHAQMVSVIGIDPPEEVTPLDSLILGEALRGIGVWKGDPYGVGSVLANKRIDRGWTPETMQEICGDGVFEPIVEQLVKWQGGSWNEWFPRMAKLPWYYGNSP